MLSVATPELCLLNSSLSPVQIPHTWSPLRILPARQLADGRIATTFGGWQVPSRAFPPVSSSPRHYLKPGQLAAKLCHLKQTFNGSSLMRETLTLHYAQQRSSH